MVHPRKTHTQIHREFDRNWAAAAVAVAGAPELRISTEKSPVFCAPSFYFLSFGMLMNSVIGGL